MYDMSFIIYHMGEMLYILINCLWQINYGPLLLWTIYMTCCLLQSHIHGILYNL